MADAAAATAEGGKAPVVATPGMSMKMVIIIIVVVSTLLLAGGGAFLMFKLMGGGHGGEEAKSETGAAKEESRSEAEKKPAAAEAKSGAAKAAQPGLIFDVEPFIVNLADMAEVRYLKLTVKLELDSQVASAELTGRMPQVRDTILVLLTSKDSASIRSTQGKFQLRDEITQRINSILPKPSVRTVYFTEFVVQ
ncbi:MAG: flagellar basal body-associated FliL family protein [Nitrospirota bacterium]|nr:flagellar basal body-associated FliL family protein [Nitrospirota bacterium]